MFSDEVVAATGLSQFGCRRPGGAIALRHVVEATLLKDPSLALVVVDISNMHGSLGVANVEEQVRAHVPRMWPLLAPWIRSGRVHVYKDTCGDLHQIEAYGPLDQGCPSSSPLACLGAIPFFCTMGLYGGHAEYQDDGYFMMKPDRVALCLDNVHNHLQVSVVQPTFRSLEFGRMGSVTSVVRGSSD